jgi:quinol monooxygenase YgiN
MNAYGRLVLALAGMVVGMTSQVEAQDTGTVFVASYIELQRSASDEGLDAVKALRDAARKDGGNLRAEALQSTSRKGQFVLLTAWKDQGALDAHLKAEPTQAAREKIKALRASPQDDRVHVALSVGDGGAAAPRGVYVVTHVDVVPPRKDDAVALLKVLAEASRKDDGNARYDVVQQASRPNHFTVVEVWRDDKAFETHGAAAHVREFRDRLAPMSGALYDERLFRAVE